MLAFRTSAGPSPAAVASRRRTASGLARLAGTTGAAGAGIGRVDIGAAGISAGPGSGAGVGVIRAGVVVVEVPLYGAGVGGMTGAPVFAAGMAAVGWYDDTPGAVGSAGPAGAVGVADVAKYGDGPAAGAATAAGPPDFVVTDDGW